MTQQQIDIPQTPQKGPILSPLMARLSDITSLEAGPWLVKHRHSTHALGLEHLDAQKYRTEADKVLDILICNAIFDFAGDSVDVFTEERGLLTFKNRSSRDWDRPTKELVDIESHPNVVVVDSLDGTLNWASRGLSNNYSTTISLLHFGQAVEVVMFFPHDRELYLARKGAGAWMKGPEDSDFIELHTSNVMEVNRSVVIVDHGKKNKGRIYPIKELLAHDELGAMAIPDLVCSSASWRAIARGGAHAFMGFTVAPEDYYPSLLVTEAGGIVTNLQGDGEWSWKQNKSVFAAANPILHQAIGFLCNVKQLGKM